MNFQYTERKSVTFVTEPHVRKCGEIYLNLQNCDEKVNSAIEKLFKREIETEMFFGENEVKVNFI